MPFVGFYRQMIFKLRDHLRGVSKRGLARNSALSFVQSAVGTACYFFVYRLLVADAGTEALGLWSLTVGIVAFGRLADVSGGAGLSRMVAIADSKHGSAKYIDTVTIATVVLYAFIILITVAPFSTLVSRSIDPKFHEVGQWLVWMTSASLFFNAVSSTQLSAIDGMHRSDVRSIIQIFGFTLFAIVSYITIPRVGVRGMAIAQVIQFIVILFVARMFLVFNVNDSKFIPYRFSWKVFTETFRYGIKLQLTSLAGLVFDPLSRVVINHFGGLSVLGIYDLSYKVTAYTRMLAVSAAAPLVPEFSRRYLNDREGGISLAKSAFSKFNSMTAFALGMTCLASPFISYFVLSELSPMFLTNIVVLSVAWYVASLGNVFQLYAQAAGILRWNIIGQWAIALASVIFGIIAGQAGHGSFVAIGVAAAIGLGSLLSLIGNLRLYGLHIDWLPPGAVGRVSLSFFATTLALLCFVAWISMSHAGSL